MKNRSNKRCLCCRAKALTLIEVVAGLAILGTLLVAVLMTEARCRRQSFGARQRLTACGVAEALLERWWAEPQKFPRKGRGRAEAEGEFSWKTSVVENEEVEQLGGQVVRLEVFHQSESWREKPVVTVDVVLPLQSEKLPEGVHAD